MHHQIDIVCLGALVLPESHGATKRLSIHIKSCLVASPIYLIFITSAGLQYNYKYYILFTK